MTDGSSGSCSGLNGTTASCGIHSAGCGVKPALLSCAITSVYRSVKKYFRRMKIVVQLEIK